MIIKYKGKILDGVVSELARKRLSKSGNFNDLSSQLIIGEEYKVLALSQWVDGGIRVYVHSLKECSFPSPYPLELFDILDSVIPKDWIVNAISDSTNNTYIIFSFKEWALDKMFYERLVEGDPEYTAIYEKYFSELNS
jgi:hypothetical protein